MGWRDLLDEAVGQVDATGHLLKGVALQPVAGLAGGSRAISALLRGEGLDAATRKGAETVEAYEGLGGGPYTDVGRARLEGLGQNIKKGGEWATQNVPGVSQASNAWDQYAQSNPGVAAAGLGLLDVGPAGRGKKAAAAAEKAAARISEKAAQSAKTTLRQDVEAAAAAATPEAPYIQTSSTTTGNLLPRGQGMYDPSTPQKALSRIGREGQFTPRMEALMENPRAKKALDTLIAKGFEINPELADWYGTYPLKQAFSNEWGGDDQWRRFLAQMGSPSQRNPVPQQNRMGSVLWNWDVQGRLADPKVRLLTNKLREQGVTEGPGALALPEGYGSLAQTAIFDRAAQMAQGVPLEQVLDYKKKLGSFDENLAGNMHPVTVDVNATKAPVMMSEDPAWLKTLLVEKDDSGKVTGKHTPRADYASGKLSMADALKRPGLWADAPEGSEYAGLERMWQDASRRSGVEPAQGQALGWYGSADISALKSPPEQYIQNIERLVRERAAATGKRPMEVLTDFLRGKGHLAVGGGAAAALAGALQEEEKGMQ